MNNGGVQQVEAGGVTYNTAVNSGGGQIVVGGAASGTTVGSGGEQVVAGGTADEATVNSGGQQVVSSGGTASGTVVASGASQVVSGGVADGTVVNSGGLIYVSSGGTASNLTVAAGAAAAERRGCELAETPLWRIEPIGFDTGLVFAARRACESVAGAAASLTSGALHDAAEVADVIAFLASPRSVSPRPAGACGSTDGMAS